MSTGTSKKLKKPGMPIKKHDTERIKKTVLLTD